LELTGCTLRHLSTSRTEPSARVCWSPASIRGERFRRQRMGAVARGRARPAQGRDARRPRARRIADVVDPPAGVQCRAGEGAAGEPPMGTTADMRTGTETAPVRTIQSLVEGLCRIPKATFTRDTVLLE